MDRLISIVARYMAKQCAGESELEQHKVQVQFGDELASAATAETIPLTAAETSDRRRLATRRTIRRPREAEQAECGRRGSESFPNFGPWVYIA